MRQIKFRAWDKQSEQMFSVYSIEFRKNGLYVNLDTTSKANGLRESWLFGDRFELMQYTGLKDKNGKEIYEADLVKHPSYPTPLRVEWDYDQWGLFDGICNEASLNDECEVTGNIYENPEILK